MSRRERPTGHGTVAGLLAHHYRSEMACAQCSAAWRTFAAEHPPSDYEAWRSPVQRTAGSQRHGDGTHETNRKQRRCVVDAQ